VIATLLYFVAIPESPVWFILKDGPSSPDAITTLNYIAWCNGSKFRVPMNAQIGLTSDTTAESRHRENSISMSVSAMQRSILSYTEMTVGTAYSQSAFQKTKAMVR
jgi:hypothetical protein